MGSSEEEFPLPPWRTPPKRKPAKPPLSQELIVATALRILDAEGLEAVSMRRVAQELETGPASLYAHVSNKEELLDLVFEEIAGEITLPGEPDPQRWQEQLKELARDVWRVLLRHRDITRVSLANIPTGPNALAVTERMLAIMLAGGVSRRAAGWAIDRIYLYVNADAYESSLMVAKVPPGVEPDKHIEEFFLQLKGFFGSLPRERFPHTVDMVSELIGGDGEQRFEFGLDLIVGGLSAFVEPEPLSP